MRKLIFTCLSFVIASSFLTPAGKADSSEYAESDMTEIITDSIPPESLYVDAELPFKGLTFRTVPKGSMLEGWYYDSTYVGNDNMLRLDSSDSTILRLSLITKDLIVNTADPNALMKIRDFLRPADGFRRFQKNYEINFGTVINEKYDPFPYMGSFSFSVDYADDSNVNVDKINNYVCHLLDRPEIDNIEIALASVIYKHSGHGTSERPDYTITGNTVAAISDSFASRTFGEWIEFIDLSDIGSNNKILHVRSHIANERFVTFGKQEHERTGMAHGLYAETFHTLDLATGEELTNSDLFDSRSLSQVKKKLLEIMAKDPGYSRGDILSAQDVEAKLYDWKFVRAIPSGLEWDDPERDIQFDLPKGALTRTGIVFSFQPYEIDSWAAGVYHFIVPYSQLMPYLTPKAKKLAAMMK